MAPLLLPLLVCQPSTGLRLLLTVAAPLLLLFLVCQPGTGLCMLLAVVVSLLLPLQVCQPGMGLYVLLAVTVPLLLPGCDGHAVEIVLKFLVQDNNISEAAATSSLQDQI
jgi:hypothetical protein